MKAREIQVNACESNAEPVSAELRRGRRPTSNAQLKAAPRTQVVSNAMFESVQNLARF